MSLPLKDLRTSIDESTDLWLEIDAQARSIDKAAIARQVLREWAKQKAHAHKIAAKRLAAHGLQPELFGDDSEDDGTSAKSVNRK